MNRRWINFARYSSPAMAKGKILDCEFTDKYNPLDLPMLYLKLEIDGVVYGSGYLESPGTYERQIFPVYDAGNQHIYVKIINTATGASCPATSLSNIRVLIIG